MAFKKIARAAAGEHNWQAANGFPKRLIAFSLHSKKQRERVKNKRSSSLPYPSVPCRRWYYYCIYNIDMCIIYATAGLEKTPYYIRYDDRVHYDYTNLSATLYYIGRPVQILLGWVSVAEKPR